MNPRNKETRKKINQSRLILLRSSLWQPQNLPTPDQQTSDISGNVDTPDTPAMPAPDASVTLGDSASNPLTISPLSEQEEVTEYWQDTEDAERSTTASEGE